MSLFEAIKSIVIKKWFEAKMVFELMESVRAQRQ